MKNYLIIILLFAVTMVNAQSAYNFGLTSSKGKVSHLNDFKDKVVVLDFWFTGCINCMNFYRTGLKDAEQRFGKDPNVVFISICIDKEKSTWLKSVEKGNYTSKTSINLYTEGKGNQHPVIKSYDVKTYPQPIVIDKTGQMISRADNLVKPNILIQTIDQALKK